MRTNSSLILDPFILLEARDFRKLKTETSSIPEIRVELSYLILLSIPDLVRFSHDFSFRAVWSTISYCTKS